MRSRCFENRRHNKTDSHSHSKHPQKTGGLYFFEIFCRIPFFSTTNLYSFENKNIPWTKCWLNDYFPFWNGLFLGPSFWGGVPQKRERFHDFFQNQRLIPKSWSLVEIFSAIEPRTLYGFRWTLQWFQLSWYWLQCIFGPDSSVLHKGMSRAASDRIIGDRITGLYVIHF